MGPYKIEEIRIIEQICNQFSKIAQKLWVVVIKRCGTFGDVSVCHLMGIKINTTSGGERLIPQKN
jgi:hypothetical protein